jgi:hypothetical protein
VAEDDDGDVDGAEDGEFVCLLEQPAFALEKRNRSIARISFSVLSENVYIVAYLLRSSRIGLICGRR